MIEPWPHTTEVSRQIPTSVLRKDKEDRPDDDLAEVRTDGEDKEDKEDKVRNASEQAETGISHG